MSNIRYPFKLKSWIDHPIFEIDYKYLEERCNIYKEELSKKHFIQKELKNIY